jgi:hypothetical protein
MPKHVSTINGRRLVRDTDAGGEGRHGRQDPQKVFEPDVLLGH